MADDSTTRLFVWCVVFWTLCGVLATIMANYLENQPLVNAEVKCMQITGSTDCSTPDTLKDKIFKVIYDGLSFFKLDPIFNMLYFTISAKVHPAITTLFTIILVFTGYITLKLIAEFIPG